ncbi:MAG: hypothetical protein RLZZ15_7, partial [Verrucomicrobiota bacterium]
AAILAGLFALLVASRFDVFFRVPFLEFADFAVNGLQIHHAKSFAEIHGNYSRYEFNHPGPAFFYVYALGERVLHDWLGLVPSPGNAHLLASAALQSFFLVAGLMLLQSVVRGRAFVPLALAAAAWFFGYHREGLTSVWPPHVLALPLFCFLAAGTVVALGRLRHAGWLVLAGGFLAHGHVVMPLFVGGIGAVAVGLGVFRWRRDGGGAGARPAFWPAHRRMLLVAGALIAIFLLPLAIDVAARGSRSNVSAILGRITANAGEPKGVGQSLLFFLSFPVASREHDRLLTTVGPETWRFLRGHLPGLLAWAAVLAGPPLVAWGWRRRLEPAERRFFCAAAALLGAAFACCLVWGVAQSGGIRHYNGYLYQGIYFFAGLLGVALVARPLEAWWRTPMSAGVVALAVVTAGYALRGRPVSVGELGLSIRDGVATALANEPTRQPRLLVFGRESWHIGAAVTLELTRREIGAYALPWWSYMFQRRHDASQFGEDLEARTVTWWIGPRGPGGILLTAEHALFQEAATLAPSGGAIDFGPGGNGFRHLVTGITDAEPDGIPRTNERRLVLRFRPERTTGAVRLIFDAEAEGTPRRAAAEAAFAGTGLGRIEAGDRGEISVVVPAALWNARPVATLELRFPVATPRRSPVRPDYERWSAWRLWRIRCESP